MTAAETFESHRSHLFAIAYRMLGSAMDAEDMVQETYLRYQSVRPESITSLRAYLTTILTRLCIDQLRMAYRQREAYPGPWLPEPIVTQNLEISNAEEGIVMRESLSLAFLVVLEKLQPIERAVFLLREVFDYDYAEIAALVGRSEAACRQIFRRARNRLSDIRSRKAAPAADQQRLLEGYVEAVQAGNTAGLMKLLAEDVTLVADGGGRIPGAATRPVVGRTEVAQFSVGINSRFLPADRQVEMSEVNYQPAVIVRSGSRILVVMTIEVEHGQVRTVRFMANPDKLAHLESSDSQWFPGGSRE